MSARRTGSQAQDATSRQDTADTFAAGQEALFLSLTLADRLRARYASIAESLDLTTAQAKALTVLQADRPLPMRVLAKLIHQDPSNLTGVVDRLEERGLIERRGSTDDRRVKGLQITPAGLALANTFREQLGADLGPLADIAPEQIVALRDILREVIGD